MYKNYQDTTFKIRFAMVFVGKIIAFTIVLQLFIFSFFFAKSIKHTDFNTKEYAKSIISLNSKIKQKNEKILMQHYQMPLFYSFSAWLSPFLIVFAFRKKNSLKKHRGAKLISAQELIKNLKKYNNLYLKIGGFDKKENILIEEDILSIKRNKKQELEYRKNIIKIPTKFENLHFFVVGRSGTGKTVLINPITKQLLFRADRILIHDYKQDFVNNFYSKDLDYLFNPVAPEKSIKWTIFNEIKNTIDIDSVTKSLIPEDNSKDPFWNNASRDILKACMIYLKETHKATNKELYKLVNSSNEEIKEALQSSENTLQYTHIFDSSNLKTLNSVMSVFRTKMKFLEHLKDIDGSFSIRRWINDGTGAIFLVNNEEVKEAISPALTLFIDIASKSLLSQPDREDKTVFLLDEFGRMGKMTSILDLLTNGRSKGASIYIGVQEFSQVDELYGRNGRKTIINACSNQIFFGVNDAESAKEISHQIGEQEYEKEDETISHKMVDEMQDFNVRKHLSTSSIVLPSEVLNLKERECFIKLADQNWTKIKVYVQKKEMKNEK